jgi:hypothetical protein
MQIKASTHNAYHITADTIEIPSARTYTIPPSAFPDNDINDVNC